MTVIAVDGLSEEDFRRSIENRLREGKPAVALERIRRLLAAHVGPSGLLPDRFMTIEAKDLVLRGWQALEPAIQRHDRPGRPITALSIAFGWPGEDLPQPDAEGHLRPFIETGYFTDDAYPFSHSARDDLLDGYSYHGCTWAADCQAVDNALSLEGVDDLHGALALLEARLLASDNPDPDGILAGSLGACLLSVLLFQAVSERIERDGLSRPLCVMAGSNGVYPYFDAPVAGFPEEARKAAEAEEDVEISSAIPLPRYSSLLLTGVPRGTKRAVLVLQESEEETAARFAHLRDQSHIAADPGLPSESTEPSVPEPQPEIAELAASPLLAKKQPGKAWDFRDMLTPREPGSPQPDREEIDWDDWSDTSTPAGEHGQAIDSEPIDWNQPFKASQPLGFDPSPIGPPPADREPVEMDLPPEVPEPDTEIVPNAPVDWSAPPAPLVEEPAPVPALEPVDWDQPSEPPPPEPEPPASEQVPVDHDAPPDSQEPITRFESDEPVDWPELPPPTSGEEEHRSHFGPIDWGVPSRTPPHEIEAAAVEPEPVDWGELAEIPEQVADFASSEPVDWSEEPLPSSDEAVQEPESGSINRGEVFETLPESSQSPEGDPETVDWPENLARPGFSLLEPSPEASVSIAYVPLPPLELAEPEPEPVAADPRYQPIPDWPLGLGWLEDHAEAAQTEAPPRPGLRARLRAWINAVSSGSRANR